VHIAGYFTGRTSAGSAVVRALSLEVKMIYWAVAEGDADVGVIGEGFSTSAASAGMLASKRIVAIRQERLLKCRNALRRAARSQRIAWRSLA